MASQRQGGMSEAGEYQSDDVSLFDSWTERGWRWNGQWVKRTSQLWWCQINTCDDLTMICNMVWLEIIHQSCRHLGTRWRNCSIGQRSKNHLAMVRGLLASAFPWWKPLRLLGVGVSQTSGLKGSIWCWWPQDSGRRYHCSDTGQICLRKSSHC